jgi:hypothetical protein
MSDFDLDALLAGAVNEYQRHTLPQIKPAGTAVAHATATHRKRVRTAAISAIALIVIAVPITAYAATEHDHNGPPTIGSSQSASPPPSASPSASPSSTPSAAATTLPPITQQELSNATLDLPAWTGDWSFCPHGRVTLHNGTIAWNWTGGFSGGQANLRKTASFDVDGDGSLDTVAIFLCAISNPGGELAVAFRRANDGSIQTMGAIAADVHQIQDVRAGTDGAVDLQVSDLAGTDDVAYLQQIIQWRTYRWTGSEFDQSDGPTAFTVSRPELTATLSDLVYNPAVNGRRTGTLTISVHNGGTAPVTDASMAFELKIAQTVTPTCQQLNTSDGPSGLCALPSIAPGATGTLTLTLSADDSWVAPFKVSPLNQIGGMFVQIRVGGLALTVQPKWGNLIIK